MKQTQTLAEELQRLRDSLDDGDSAYYVLNTLILAVEAGRVEEMEDAITPLVERWLAESVEDELAMWKATVP